MSFTLLALALQVADGSAGFQEFRLGQSIADAKAVEMPSERIQLYCSDDVAEDFPTRWLDVKPEQASDGVVHCLTGNWVSGMFAPVGLPVTETAKARVNLYFLDGVLAEIITEYSFVDTLTIGAALRAKYGEPDRDVVGAVENRFGGRSDQLITSWGVGDATIELRSPDRTRYLMTVTYRGPSASAFWQRVRSTGAGDANL